MSDPHARLDAHDATFASIHEKLDALAASVAELNRKLDARGYSFQAGVVFTLSAIVASIAGAFAYLKS